MPIHDWSQIDCCLFHDFHQSWTVELCNALNHGSLPQEFYAMLSPSLGGPSPGDGFPMDQGTSSEVDVYAKRASRICVKHRLGRAVAVIELVSPGNKSSQSALRAFVAKAEELIQDGISLLIVDLFPPSIRDPQGIHKAIWDLIQDEPFELPPDKLLTVAAYLARPVRTAYVEPVAVGDLLPSLPIFLDEKTYVPAPLEQTYQTTWSKCPEIVRQVVLGTA